MLRRVLVSICGIFDQLQLFADEISSLLAAHIFFLSFAFLRARL